MTHSPPPNPKPEKPMVGATWFDDACEMQVWDGTAWVTYEDPPDWPGEDPDPNGLYKDA